MISDSDSESIADDMDSARSDLEMNDDEGEGWEIESESGWEDEDSDSSWDSEKDQSAPVLMKLGFKPMIDINLKCNNYIRQLCADIYSSGAQTIVLFDWDNQSVPESMLSINPRDSGVYSISGTLIENTYSPFAQTIWIHPDYAASVQGGSRP